MKEESSEIIRKVCFICGQIDENIILFKQATLDKCNNSLAIRITCNLKDNDKILPSQITDDSTGYHAACYRSFNAIGQKYKTVFEKTQANKKDTGTANTIPEPVADSRNTKPNTSEQIPTVTDELHIYNRSPGCSPERSSPSSPVLSEKTTKGNTSQVNSEVVWLITTTELELSPNLKIEVDEEVTVKEEPSYVVLKPDIGDPVYKPTDILCDNCNWIFLDTSQLQEHLERYPDCKENVEKQEESITAFRLDSDTDTCTSGSSRETTTRFSAKMESQDNFYNELFIEEVEKRIAIWDMESMDYSNRHLKRRAWEELAELFCNSGDSDEKKKVLAASLQKKWKGFRDCFVRERKRNKNAPPGSEASSGSSYKYFQRLTFLERSIKDKPADGIEDTPVEKLPLESPVTSQGTGKDVIRPPLIKQPKKKIKITEPDTKFLNNIPKSITSRAQPPPPPHTSCMACIEYDDEKLFCLSLHKELLKVHEDRRLETKIELMSIIHKAQQLPRCTKPINKLHLTDWK